MEYPRVSITKWHGDTRPLPSASAPRARSHTIALLPAQQTCARVSCTCLIPPSIRACGTGYSGPVRSPARSAPANELALGHTAGDSRRCAADHRRRFAPPAIRRLGRTLRLGPRLDQDSQDLLSPRPFAVDHSLARPMRRGVRHGWGEKHGTYSQAARYGGMYPRARSPGRPLPLGRF